MVNADLVAWCNLSPGEQKKLAEESVCHDIVDKAVALFRSRNPMITPRLAVGPRTLTAVTEVRILGGEP